MICLNKLYEKACKKEPSSIKKIIFTETEICSVSAPISAVLSVIVFLGIFFVTTISITLFFSFSKFNILNSLNIYKKIFFIAAFVFGFFFVLFGFSISVLFLDFLLNFVFFNMVVIIATKMKKSMEEQEFFIKDIPVVGLEELQLENNEYLNSFVNDSVKVVKVNKLKGKIVYNVRSELDKKSYPYKDLKDFLNVNNTGNIYELEIGKITYYFSDIYYNQKLDRYFVNCCLMQNNEEYLHPVVFTSSNFRSCWKIVSHLEYDQHNKIKGLGKARWKGNMFSEGKKKTVEIENVVANLPTLLSFKLNSMLEKFLIKNKKIKSEEIPKKFIRKKVVYFNKNGVNVFNGLIGPTTKQFICGLGEEPDFSKCIKKRIRKDKNYDEITEFFILSNNKEFLYTFLLDSSGKIFLSDGEYFEKNQNPRDQKVNMKDRNINRFFGVRDYVINFNDINKPLKEYKSQTKNVICNWNDIRKIPIIKKFYEHFKIPIPSKLS